MNYLKAYIKEPYKQFAQKVPRLDAPLLSKLVHGLIVPSKPMMAELCGLFGAGVFDLYDREDLDYTNLTSKQRRADTHKLRCRISCRLPDEDFAALQQFIRADGFDTMQSFTFHMMQRYLKRKRKSASAGTNRKDATPRYIVNTYTIAEKECTVK